MPVEFSCDGCNRRLRAPDAKAGKKTTCPSCGKELQIPVMSTAAPISLPTAGTALPVHPLDKLAAAIPTAKEAASAFNLSKPAEPAPSALGDRTVEFKPNAGGGQNEIGLAPIESEVKPVIDPAPSVPSQSPSSSSSGSTSSSGIGGKLKSKSNAWRGGNDAPGNPPAQAAPHPPQEPFSIPTAVAVPAQPASPLDDLFKNIPQRPATPAEPSFADLKPVASSDPFASIGTALPQTPAPRWDQIAASANVASSNPYASPSASPFSGGGGGRRNANVEAVRGTVIVPGIFLLICHIFMLLGTLLRLGLTAIGLTVIAVNTEVQQEIQQRQGELAGVSIGLEVLFAILFFVLSVVGLFGAIKMIRVKNYSSAKTASILAIFPFCFCFPIGIWALVVLSQDNVKRAFEANTRN